MRFQRLDQILSDSSVDRRFYTITTSAFGFLAFLLAIVGLAVVTARFVIEKRRDLAIRTALGATPGDLARVVYRHGLAPILAGGFIGATGANLHNGNAARSLSDHSRRVTQEPGLGCSRSLLAYALSLSSGPGEPPECGYVLKKWAPSRQ